MRRAYKPWKPGAEALDVVQAAVDIIGDYSAQGYTLTLRQLYYQFVARALIANNMRSYKNLLATIDRARLAGMIDWSAIEDRTRNLAGGDGVTRDPADVLAAYADHVDVSRWDDQPMHVEVWVEKEALAGVVQRAAARRHVAYFSCRGYVSQSEMHAAAQRLRGAMEAGKGVLLLHLGDHDPSGIDMTRDIRDRLETFIAVDWLRDVMGVQSASRDTISDDIAGQVGDLGGKLTPGAFLGLEVRRIALNENQIEAYSPPPNPAKLTDSRANSYVERFGYESWELDALDPATLNDLIVEHVDAVIDRDRWRAKLTQRDELRTQYATVADNWDDIQEQFA